jgi:hypothetical protein
MKFWLIIGGAALSVQAVWFQTKKTLPILNEASSALPQNVLENIYYQKWKSHPLTLSDLVEMIKINGRLLDLVLQDRDKNLRSFFPDMLWTLLQKDSKPYYRNAVEAVFKSPILVDWEVQETTNEMHFAMDMQSFQMFCERAFNMPYTILGLSDSSVIVKYADGLLYLLKINSHAFHTLNKFMLDNIQNLRLSRNKASANRILNLYVQWAASHSVHLGKQMAIQEMLKEEDGRLDPTSLKHLVAYGTMYNDMELVHILFPKSGKIDMKLYTQALVQSFFSRTHEALDYLLNHEAFHRQSKNDLDFLFVSTAAEASWDKFQKLFQVHPGLIEGIRLKDWVAAISKTIRGYRLAAFEFLFLHQKSRQLSDVQLSFFLRSILNLKSESSWQYLEIILAEEWAITKISSGILQTVLHRCIYEGNRWHIFEHIIISSSVLEVLSSLEVSHIITALARRLDFGRSFQVMQKASTLGKLDNWAISEVFYIHQNDNDFLWPLKLFRKHPEWVERAHPNYLESVLERAMKFSNREVVLEFLRNPIILNKIDQKVLKRIAKSSKKEIKEIGRLLYTKENKARFSKWSLASLIKPRAR